MLADFLLLMQLLSHLKDPPFPEETVAPGFPRTKSSFLTQDLAFSNILSRTLSGTLFISESVGDIDKLLSDPLVVEYFSGIPLVLSIFAELQVDPT